MKKKLLSIIALICCIVLVTALLAGCESKVGTEGPATSGSTADEASAAPADTKPAEPKLLNFWVYETPNQDVLELIVRGYEQESGNNVEILYIPRTDFPTKVTAALAVNENPDVSYIDQPLVAQYAADGILLKLDGYMDGSDGINKNDYFEGALNTNKVGDSYYGLPMNQTCIAMFYNKDLIPSPPTTWSEMLETAKKVYVKGKIAAFERPWDGGGGAWMFPAYLGTAGIDIVNADQTKVQLDAPEAAEALKFFWGDLMQYADKEVYQSSNAFGNGKVGMKMSGPWDVEGLKKDFPNLKFGIALIPKKDGKDYASNMGGENLVAYANTKSPEAAWKLMKTLTTDENSIPLAKQVTGNFPVRMKAAEDKFYSTDEHIKVFMEQMKYAKPRPRITSWLKINDEVIGKAINEFIAGNKTAEEAMKEANEKANALIAESKQ